MKIALYNSDNGHHEVFGFLIELFKEHSISIFYNSDRFGYINYFESINNKKLKHYSCDNLVNRHNRYDIIFVITMTSDLPGFFSTIKNKVYGFLHAHHRKSPYIDNYITLYPNQMIQFKQKIRDNSKNFKYMFPFYNTPNKIQFTNRKYILQIGNFFDNDKDFENFKTNVNYEIILFTKGQRNGIKRDMRTTEEYLNNALFILGRKTWHYDHSFTGSLTLAYSFNVPIILPKFKQQEYDVPCVTFNTEYSELIDYINNIDEYSYNKLLDEMNTKKKEEIKHNIQTIDAIMN